MERTIGLEPITKSSLAHHPALAAIETPHAIVKT
jgi:hypothetical protein